VPEDRPPEVIGQRPVVAERPDGIEDAHDAGDPEGDGGEHQPAVTVFLHGTSPLVGDADLAGSRGSGPGPVGRLDPSRQRAVGRAVVEVLERSGIAVQVHYARCCGMPFTDTGDLAAARRNARRNVAELIELVERGATIVVPGPSCSLMLKHEYPRLLGTEDARRVAASTRDVMEHLYELAREGVLDRNFQTPLGAVAYHAPCHLRAQNVGLRARDLLQLAGAEVTLVDACSGVDGTWGMQARFFAESQKIARKMVRGIEDSGASAVSTDCPLSALRIEQATGRKPVHPVLLLARAYGIDP